MTEPSGAAPLDPRKLVPRVSPIGILERGDSDAAAPRSYPKRLRMAALVLVAIFLAVVVVTTALSLGNYCLTTDAGSLRPARTRSPSSSGRPAE